MLVDHHLSHLLISSNKVALVTLALHPNPYMFGHQHFNQTLDIASATMFLTVGGNATDPAVSLTVFVDAYSNTVYASATSLDSTQAYQFTATLEPVRPLGYASYTAPFHCTYAPVCYKYSYITT